MKSYAIIIFTVIVCLSFTGIASAQGYTAQRTDVGKSEREVVVTPVVKRTVASPVPVSGRNSVQSVSAPAGAITGAGVPTQTVDEPRTFWQATKEMTVTASKATWSGIKKGSIWTWRGICKGSYYMKEGCVSVAEKTGLIKDHELDAHQDIVNLANKTLVESQTKREIREDSFKRENALGKR